MQEFEFIQKRVQIVIKVVVVLREEKGEAVLARKQSGSLEFGCPWRTCTAGRRYRSAVG